MRQRTCNRLITAFPASRGGFSGKVKQHLLSGIVNQLFPSQCPSCSSRTDNVSVAPFCIRCWSAIKRYSGPACRICATPLSSQYSDVCAGCLKDPPPFSRALGFGIYEGTLADAIHCYKFRGIRRLHKPLARLMLEIDAPGTDALIPVPLTLSNLRERGFNQSLLLARVISKKYSLPLIFDGLLKREDTLPQIGLSAAGRRSNIRGAFRAARRFDGMRLMLIDDVMTTGATARECSKQLMKAGAKEVLVLVLARASAV